MEGIIYFRQIVSSSSEELLNGSLCRVSVVKWKVGALMFLFPSKEKLAYDMVFVFDSPFTKVADFMGLAFCFGYMYVLIN